MNKIYYPGWKPKRLSPTQRQILVNVRDGRPYGDGLPKHGVEPALHVVMSNRLMQWGLYNPDDGSIGPPTVTPDGLRALEEGHYRDRNKDHARALRYQAQRERPRRVPGVQGPPRSARKLKLASGTWRWVVTRGTITIWSPSGKAITHGKCAPLTRSACSCDPWNCYPEYAVTPGTVRRFIEEELLDA